MASSHIRRSDRLADGKWALWAVALFFIGLLSLRLADVFAGNIPDADDHMRLQQIRDLLNGQNWFNVDQSRLLTPEGGEMHWSRLPDLFVAGVILLTEPWLGREAAENLAMGLWPLVLLGGVFALLATVMQRLGIGLIGQLFGFAAFATSAAVFNFWPGRIDHHGLVVLLALGGLAAALSPQQSARSGWVLALCTTAMLSVAFEGLPYVAGLIAIMGFFWVARGHREGVRLSVFGLGLILFSSAFFLLDSPGFGSRRFVCDAYGTSHWVGLSLGGGLLCALGVFGGLLDTWFKRMLAGAAAGLVTLAAILLINPACLADPYAAVPDAVKLSWLSIVGEAKTLSTLLTDEPDRVVWVFGFIAAGGVGTAIMLAKASAEQRLSRSAFALMLVLSVVATVWQIRGQSFSHVFAAIGAAWLVGWLWTAWRESGGVQALLVFALAALAMSPLSWETASTRFAKPLAYEDQGVHHNLSCIRPEAYTALAATPAMRLHTPVILGPFVLSRTPHAVFSGPYHRNIEGIARANAVMLGPVDAARAQLLDMGATHLLYCRGLNETNRYGLLWPEGFAAALNRDEIPDWLEPVDGLTETEGTVRLYRIKPQ